MGFIGETGYADETILIISSFGAMESGKQESGTTECGKDGLLAIKDTMELLSGK